VTAWVCIVTLEADTDQEVSDMVAGLKDRFGERLRTRTLERWLYEAERQPVAPLSVSQVAAYAGPRGHFRRNR
jgi:hypothetical protein